MNYCIQAQDYFEVLAAMCQLGKFTPYTFRQVRIHELDPDRSTLGLDIGKLVPEHLMFGTSLTEAEWCMHASVK